MLGLAEHAQLPQLAVEILHVFRHARTDGAEVMIVQLLPLGRLRAEERAAAELQILALFIERLIDQEIFLLRADLRRDALRLVVAEQAENAQRLAADGLHGAQQGRLLVERVAAVGAEDRRDAETAVLDKREGRRIPGAVAARFKRGAQTAGREARRVRLAADQLLAGKLHGDPAAADGADKAVVLLGRHAVERLEPVRIMRRAMLERPLLHAARDLICDLQRQGLILLQTFFPRGDGTRRDILRHGGLIKNHAAEQLGDRVLFTHAWRPPLFILLKTKNMHRLYRRTCFASRIKLLRR